MPQLIEEPPYESEEECLQDFFQKNLEQLKDYQSHLDDVIHEKCEFAIIKNIQENIKQKYLPHIQIWLRIEYLKESQDVQEFVKKLNKLKMAKVESFKRKLNELCNDLKYNNNSFVFNETNIL
ncbi:18213_t:CDS:1 [Gigaspora margarita]|uniref:18213_t:CDS:1 n=1 Tax=Gigaspora margarita TaxID=4874 RepID=A0ABN7VE49_GIGMA|nr:18213_t:CDS:1 [Gigaspora margarita]